MIAWILNCWFPFGFAAEIAWQEMRKKWVGDPSKRTSEMPMEPVIGYYTS